MLRRIRAAGPAEDLQARLSAIDHLTARFEQRVIDPDGSELQRSSGTVHIARGNRFSWQTEWPWPQSLVSDGETLWQYEPDLEQVVVRPVDPDLQHTPSLLFGGDPKALEEAYEVARIDGGDGSGHRYRLQPLAGDSLFESLEIAFDDGAPTALALVDAFGQRTEIRFEDVDSTTPPGPERFRFEIPDGVDVLVDD